MSEFEKQVRHALIDNNMTMKGLAEQLGLSVSYVYEIIKGTRNSDEQKARIKQMLGISDTISDE